MNSNDAALGVFLIAGICFIVGIIVQGVVKLRTPKKDATVARAIEALEQRFARVEVALDEVTSELHRVSEGNGFLTRLLSERGREVGKIERQ
jgi:uncharacterized membrane protein